jgi:hypothetical protein
VSACPHTLIQCISANSTILHATFRVGAGNDLWCELLQSLADKKYILSCNQAGDGKDGVGFCVTYRCEFVVSERGN